jgi:hypothetical protein
MTETFLALAIGLAVGIWVTDRFHRRIMRDFLEAMNFSEKDLARLQQRLQQKLANVNDPEELPVLEVKIEEHSGVLFAFRKDTDQFLGQGPDRDALIDRLKENLTNVRLIIDKEDGADLLQKNNT